MTGRTLRSRFISRFDERPSLIDPEILAGGEGGEGGGGGEEQAR